MGPNWFIGLRVQAPRLAAAFGEAPPGVRLFTAGDLHMTVAFLGDVDEERALVAWRQAEQEAGWHRVQGAFGGVRALGNPRKPSALAVLASTGRREAEAMIAKGGRLLQAAGRPAENRPPLAHVTVARIQRRASPEQRMAARDWLQRGMVEGVGFELDALVLYTWAHDRKQQLFRAVRVFELGD